MFYSFGELLSHERRTARSYDVYHKMREAKELLEQINELKDSGSFKNHDLLIKTIKSNSYKIEKLMNKTEYYQTKVDYYTYIYDNSKDRLIDNIEACEHNLFQNSIYGYYSAERVEEEKKKELFYREMLRIKNKNKYYVDGCIKKFEKLKATTKEEINKLKEENSAMQLEADKIKAEMTPKKLKQISDDIYDFENSYNGRPRFGGYSRIYMLSNVIAGYIERNGHIEGNPIIKAFQKHVEDNMSEYERNNPKPLVKYADDTRVVDSFVREYAKGNIVIKEKPDEILKYEVPLPPEND